MSATVEGNPKGLPPSFRNPRRESSSSMGAQAAASLALLLREDPLLTEHKMHINPKTKDREEEEDTHASFSYAAALLLENDEHPGRNIRDHQQQAEDALGEVDRKLALVESLAERVSRTSPEAVAGPLLKLHGHEIATIVEEDEERISADDGNTTATSTLVATRERCDRLKRQGVVLEGVAARVETSLTRGLTRMEKATNRLSRVLQLSATLKMILRLQFEASKLENFMLDDLNDLKRAAASVAVIEDLLSKPELQRSTHTDDRIEIVESIRPKAVQTAAAVREAAAALLAQQQKNRQQQNGIIQLGATLQVYYHLGELPQAAWSAVGNSLLSAEKATSEFWSPTTLTNLEETATSEAKISAASKKLSDLNVQRALKNKLKEYRARAATKWAEEIAEASLQVWNLQQVLVRKSDPISRQVFRDVVAAAPIPEKFRSVAKGFNGGEEESDEKTKSTRDWSIFDLYWDRLCQRMGDRLKHIITYENGKFTPNIAALYPATRAATLNMLASLQDIMQATEFSGSKMMMSSLDETAAETSASASMGLLGGSFSLDDPFLRWSTQVIVESDAGNQKDQEQVSLDKNKKESRADTWTLPKEEERDESALGSGVASSIVSSTTKSLSSVFNSSEWIVLKGNHASQKGLFRMQIAFLTASSERLCAPLQYMFAENVSVDDVGNAISHLPLLPSKYDIQRFDTIIRQELAMADPREGGGELSAVTMIAEAIVRMITQFCAQAENAMTKLGEDGCIALDGSPTEALVHDMKVTKIMYFLWECLNTAPVKVFLEPYRPAVTHQLEEASSIATQALLPARNEIESMVQKTVLRPLSEALNKRVGKLMGRMHLEGAYLNHTNRTGMDSPDLSSSFVQKHLSGFFDNLYKVFLQKLPQSYSVMVGSAVSIFSVFSFVSTASLIRPMGEAVKMQLTQDLADFELVVDQFMTQASGSTKTLGAIGNGKAYAELRAFRQMLFWTGLEDQSKSSSSVAKTLSREVWVRDIRASTVCHYLFSFAPDLLTSPHHWKRLKIEEYVGTLVSLDGNTEEGESLDWMTTLACCDSYKQRESAQSSFLADNSSDVEGDPRIAAILMALGPELLQRRRP